jgi:hypothetical protein
MGRNSRRPNIRASLGAAIAPVCHVVAHSRGASDDVIRWSVHAGHVLIPIAARRRRDAQLRRWAT